MNILTYIDETDRSFGISGMAISMAVLDDCEKIMDIDIDRSNEPINFTHEFFFSGNPRCSAKMVWNEITRNFNLSMAMAMGNILSRRIIAEKGRFTDNEEQQLRDIAIAEGLEVCGLETDEVERLWDKDFNYLAKVFQHPAVIELARTMASEIQKRRTLTRQEINDILSALNRW